MSRRRLRFTCRGHENLRATHHKTLEVTRDEEISTRATCIVGVGADFEPRAVARLRGPVRVELRVGDLEQSFEAIVPPFVGARPSLVFRRSDQRFGNTFAHDASRVASDLDRALVRRLASPEARLEVEIRELGTVPEAALGGLTLLAVAEPRLAALSAESRARLAAVDAVVGLPEDELADLGADPPRRLELSGRSVDDLLALLAAGERLAVVQPMIGLGDGGPLSRLVAEAVERGVAVAAAQGVAAETALRAAAGLVRRRVLVDREPVKKRRQLEQRLRAAAVCDADVVLSAVRLPADEAAAAVVEACGDRRIALGAALGTAAERIDVGAASALAEMEMAERRSDDDLLLAIAGEDASEVELPEALLRALLDQGVPVKTLGRGLEKQLGWPRRRAYETILALVRDDAE